jgi:hypothetical protein
VHHTSQPVQVATTTPLLRLVLTLLLGVAAFAGLLVASSAQLGWIALGFALVAGPVAVVVESRSRNRAERSPRSGTSSVVGAAPDAELA